MSLLEDEAMNQLIKNIKSKKIEHTSDNKQKKDNNCEKNCCIAAVRYNTIGNAYKDIQNNINVYLIEDELNGSKKVNAYAQCSKTALSQCSESDYEKSDIESKLCHLHRRMIKSNSEGLKIFEKDILPTSINDKKRWLANVNDDFFENMGKRGAKKKNSDNNFLFPNENHPILLILNHKNAKLSTLLTVYASQLLKNNSNTDFHIEKESKVSSKKDKNNDISKNLNNLISLISSNGIDLKSKKTKADLQKCIENFEDKKLEDDEESEEDDEVESINTSIEKSNDLEEDDSVPCVPIKTIKGKLLWLNEENNTVYEPEGEDGGEELGILKEISKDYSTIIHNKKSYTIIIEINHKNRGKINCCVLTDSLFDKKMNLIGTRTKLKNNDYRFDFSDEI
jgi:hypothetical protein